jgi:hypothetical protein
MRVLICDEVLDLLPMYCDDELDVATQLEVRSHLAWCETCRIEADAVDFIGSTLRAASAVRLERTSEDVSRVHNGVLARVATEGQPFLRRMARAQDDLHMLWIAAAATTAAILCVALALGVGRLTLREVPYSMAAVIGAMASPGSNSNPISVDGRVLLPRTSSDHVPVRLLRTHEGFFPLSAVVTREGEVRNVSLLLNEAELGVSTDVTAIINAASRVRFEPARAAGGSPVAVNVVWLLAHTTVVARGDGDAVPIPRMRDLPSRSPSTGVPISQGPSRLRLAV